MCTSNGLLTLRARRQGSLHAVAKPSSQIVHLPPAKSVRPFGPLLIWAVFGWYRPLAYRSRTKVTASLYSAVSKLRVSLPSLAWRHSFGAPNNCEYHLMPKASPDAEAPAAAV